MYMSLEQQTISVTAEKRKYMKAVPADKSTYELVGCSYGPRKLLVVFCAVPF
jgi:hypothetical protein